MLNRVCGCTVFHIWNVDQVPDVDVGCLLEAVEMEREIRNA